MILEVNKAQEDDVYNDIARIPEIHRKDGEDNKIVEGQLCKITVGRKYTYAFARGKLESEEPCVYIDDRIRGLLGVKVGDKVEFSLKQASLVGRFRWAWNASDPAYRIAAQVAIISAFLGITGFVLGVISLLLR